MQRISLVALCLLWPVPLSLRADEAREGFRPLFDGKTLTGWRKAGGGATYKVVDGCIVGEVGPGANTFLCTEKDYGNFILKAEVKLDVPGNSGIQFRSHKRIKDDRVYGYQCEIDPSARAWSAGIYDEGRRGWLYPLTGPEHDKARRAFKGDGWNQFVIEANGPRLRTWLNDVACADLLDTMDAEGFIALQVHSGKAGRIRFRNLLLKELPPTPWQPLFNGKDLRGWKKIGGGDWKVAGGVMHGSSTKEEKRHGHLVTDREYTDFAVRLKYKANKGNSGLYFRIEEVPGDVGVKGFQAEIDPDNDVGGLYETNGRGWVVKPKPEDVKKWHKRGAWNELSVVALGDRIAVHVNGKKTAELKKDPGRRSGRIALQLHGGQDMDVQFEDVQIMPLPAMK